MSTSTPIIMDDPVCVSERVRSGRQTCVPIVRLRLDNLLNFLNLNLCQWCNQMKSTVPHTHSMYLKLPLRHTRTRVRVAARSCPSLRPLACTERLPARSAVPCRCDTDSLASSTRDSSDPISLSMWFLFSFIACLWVGHDCCDTYRVNDVSFCLGHFPKCSHFPLSLSRLQC